MLVERSLRLALLARDARQRQSRRMRKQQRAGAGRWARVFAGVVGRVNGVEMGAKDGIVRGETAIQEK
ncbi:hypothetical protein RirG_100560 [Rhizophagus irregularis DAOM 197198w]|uniref:Uncharacterized protein n=1 Tax=Rhizophagus irregularis (strain DAOM 197198w) TaxID=1432141 RepID=A0A015MQ78_RHIIW|nr:hypothetical protein RirG_100560 [Rhizophagus irregularis DAOM 197198w]